jgi:hypothetical protein
MCDKPPLDFSSILPLLLGSESNLGTLRVEHNVLALEENVTEDGQTDARVGLETTVGVAGVNSGKANVISGNGSGVVTNLEGQIGGSGAAGENVTTLGRVVLGTINLLVVGVDNAVVEEEQSGTGV